MSLFAHNVCRHEAENTHGFPQNTCVISITEEWERADLHFPDGQDLLRIQFADVTQEIRYEGRTYEPIDTPKAQKLVKFIRSHKDMNFIVHCHAGVSRSSAVCLFIHLTFGHHLRDDFWNVAEPNPLVLGRLTKEHHRVGSLIVR